MKKISIIIAVVSIGTLVASCSHGERCPAYGAQVTPTDNQEIVSTWMGHEEQTTSTIAIGVEE